MKRVGPFVAVIIVAIGAYVVLGRSVTAETPSQAPYWERQDRAAYVVSTLNLLRAPNGRSIVASLTHPRHRGRFAVYADRDASDVYFVEIRGIRHTGSQVLVYRMGWPRPEAITSWRGRFRVRRAPAALAAAYRHDGKILIGSFRSIPGS